MARSQRAQPNVTLDEYQDRYNIPEWAFNGVENPNETLGGCDHIWSQWERDQLARAINWAEGQLAYRTMFWYGRKFWEDGGIIWRDPIQLPWHHISCAGDEEQDAVTPSASDFTTDPATITVAQTDFSGGTGEIYIIETSTGLEIVPDSIAISGVNYVVSIGQEKLLQWSALATQTTANPITYDALFPNASWLKLAELTVYRRYCSASDQATITFGPSCRCGLCGTAGVGSTHTGVVYTKDSEISEVRVQLADYSAATGAWTCSYPDVWGCYDGSHVLTKYSTNVTDTMHPGFSDAILDLAHTRVVIETCGCSLFREEVKWARSSPEGLTATFANNPLGRGNGAWSAWQWSLLHMHGVAILGGDTGQKTHWLL